MRPEFSLLRRLESQSKEQQYTTCLDTDQLLLDISNNVQDMLNVRLGSVQAIADYGMPDFNDVVKEFPDAITKIRFSISEFITNYEPRLTGIQVDYLHDPEQPLALKFLISGRLSRAADTDRVNFSTVLTGSGQATVKM